MALANCQFCGGSFYNGYTLRRHLNTCKIGLAVKRREKKEKDPPPSNSPAVVGERGGTVEGGGTSEEEEGEEEVISSPAVTAAAVAAAENFVCSICRKRYKRHDNLLRHVSTKHKNEELSYNCGLCSSCFLTLEELDEHRKEHVFHTDFRLLESAHKKQCQLLRADFPSDIKSLDQSLEYAYDHLCRLTSSLSTKMSYYKLNPCIFLEMYKLGMEGEISQVEVFPFRGKSVRALRDREQVKKEMRMAVGDMEKAVDEFIHMGSGWIVSHPMHIDAEIVQCLPLHGKGGCTQHSVNYERKKGITPKIGRGEDDGMCFFLAVASYFCQEGAADSILRIFIRDILREVPENNDGMPLKKIENFEKANHHLDLSINVVYKDEHGDILPAYATKKHKASNMIVLMLFCTSQRTEEGQKDTMHYAAVKHPEKLFAIRSEEKDGKQNTESIFICWNCFNVIRKKQAYETHISFCHENTCQRVTLPFKGETVSFQGSQKMEARSFKSAFMLFFISRHCKCLRAARVVVLPKFLKTQKSGRV